MSPDSPKRLIEVAFPLKQTSLDSVHEKNVRHGHISTLHIWPARRPLAACRAALIATLLPDPGDPEERKMILEKLGGKVVKKVKKKKDAEGRIVEEIVEETEGGILHWGRENGPDLEWFRQKIREAYGGRPPKVLDPFAGGGAIPLEAMRLGCEATAVDINPVAWFILKCTLEYPQKLAGQKRPLPEFVLQDREFMHEYLKAQGYKGKELELQLEKSGFGRAADQHLPGLDTVGVSLEADLAWHVRAWGRWVLKEARKELAPYYPTYADFEPLVEVTGKVEKRPMQLVPLKEDGTPDVDTLNAEFTPEYLADKRNPRWVAKPTVGYLWARTVTCKNCRATIPLLKTRWLCKKPGKRVVLTMQPNPEKTGVFFGVQNDVPVVGKTAAERKDYDTQVGSGTMSRSGATCPCCGGIMTTEDIRLEGKVDHLDVLMTAVIIDGLTLKEYRLPTKLESSIPININNEIDYIFERIPFELPKDKLPISREQGNSGFRVILYGMDEWQKLFTKRQLVAIGTLVLLGRSMKNVLNSYPHEWIEALISYIAILVNKITDYNSSICTWHISREVIGHTFVRFALPMTWDFVEIPISNTIGGGIESQIDWISRNIENGLKSLSNSPSPRIINASVNNFSNGNYDAIITDPPYYDAIAYADVMDYFYVWTRRSIHGLSEEIDEVTSKPLSPKWDHETNDGELIDDPTRFGGDRDKSKNTYEDGMYQAFQSCYTRLNSEGIFVIVFAHKDPNAWETLVAAIIRSGFFVIGSWPIETEMPNRTIALNTASLASSVWLVCKKRSKFACPGWDNIVLDEMRAKITSRLRDFWDVGIRGPDFVWAATGPALEAYSQYPVVKKANQPGEVLTVSEFLTQVRRMVVDFVVGRVLSSNGEEVTGLDSPSAYYLLHRYDFGMSDAPAGPCILYAVSCGLSDKDLADRYDLLARRGGKEQVTEDIEGAEEESGEEAEGSGSAFRLKAWNQRKNPRMGYDPATDNLTERLPLFPDMEREALPSKEIPLIDQVHRLMHLWKGGDVNKVNEYLDLRGLRRNPLFHQLLQALIELAHNEERTILEAISNHVGGRQHSPQPLFKTS